MNGRPRLFDRLVDAVRRARRQQPRPTDAGTRLINQHFPRQWGDTLTLAIRSAQPVTSPAVRERVTSALTPFGRAEHVTAVGSAYQAPGRTSAHRHIAFATVQFGVKASKIPAGEAKALMNDARAASGGGWSFYLGGDVVDMSETSEGGPSDGIGVIAATIVLLISDHTSQAMTGPARAHMRPGFIATA
jgi:RND superfamily putative drug exporter